MAYNPTNANGQATMANSSPVVIASNQSNIPVTQGDSELGNSGQLSGLRDVLVAQRSTTWSDSLADGIAGSWTQTNANGGTSTASGGEGLIRTSTAAAGSAQLSSPVIAYFPGQVAWVNSAVRMDAGVAGNIRRIGMFTVSGLTPQDGFYFELDGTTLYAVTAKGGTALRVAAASWSKVATAPFTIDTNYHGYEIRFTANSVWFYVDNVLRHVVAGTSATLTNTLTLPITMTNVKTSGATDVTLAVRNIGSGRFGERGVTGLEPQVSGGLSTYHLVSLASANLNVIKNHPGQVFGWYIYNSNTSARKVNLHNLATTPVAGANIFLSLVIPPSSGANVEFTNGIQFTNGIGISTTTGFLDNDTGVVAANDLVINIFYK